MVTSTTTSVVVLLGVILIGSVVGDTTWKFSAASVAPTPYSGIIQTLTIPAGVYRISIIGAGASGGNGWGSNSTLAPGRGAVVSGEFSVTPFQNLSIVVGVQGGIGGANYIGGSGGGGSFVWLSSNNTLPWIAAGGGGGSASITFNTSILANYGRSASLTASGTASASGYPGAADGNSSCSESGGKGWKEIRTLPDGPVGKHGWFVYGGYGGGGGGGMYYTECCPSAAACLNHKCAAGAGGGYSGGAPGVIEGQYAAGGGGSYNGAIKNGQISISSTMGDGFVNITAIAVCQNGVLFSPNTCLCDSGWSGSKCDIPPTPCAPAIVDKNTIANQLVINSTSFSNNTLTAYFNGPFVTGRTYTNFTQENSIGLLCAAGSSTNPFYDGMVWSTSTAFSCQDNLVLSIPWSRRAECGFTLLYSDDAYTVYYTKISVTYQDIINYTIGYTPVTRSTTQQFKLYVTFPKSLSVSIVGLSVDSNAPTDFALTSAVYSSNTTDLSVEITTGMVYSYMLKNTTTIKTPTGVTSSPIAVDNSACTTTTGSYCLQKLRFKLVASSCSYDGVYTVNATQAYCRESSGYGCLSNPVILTFSLTGGSFCAEVNTQTAVTGSLAAFSTIDFSSAPKYSYKVGDQIYFLVTTNAGFGNTVTLTFANITFDDNSGSGPQFLLLNKVKQNFGNSSSLILNNAGKFFTLYLSNYVFHTTVSATYTFSASAEVIVGAGSSKKRTVQYVWETKQGDDGDAMKVVKTNAKVEIIGQQGMTGSGTQLNVSPTICILLLLVLLMHCCGL